ncbi:mucin-5AC-like isoform X3 [Crassostrea angulata]|uniref:mucin-5AC-like isoform X3 n=1 Tax=Magallana angulata TaxID=2784310 RepID=UPI0022B15285|nr:mucin-5AC-like isoform X3 [Crassostrea angulata]
MWNRNDEYDWYHGQRNYIPLSSTRGNWMNILIGERNVDGDSSIASSSKPRRTTIRGNSRSRKTCVTTTLVGIAFVLLLLGASCVPLILYFVEKDQYKYYKADGSITFEGTYDDSLGNLSTQTSIDFQQDFCQVMEQTQANKFKESYSGCLVTKIKNGSIIVEFTMYYYAKVTVEPDEVKEEIIVNLKTNLTETFSSKFSITVDVNSLTVSLLQTGENDFQSGKSDSRFQTSLLSSTTKGTTSTILPTISSNTENSTSTENDTTTAGITAATTMPVEPFAVVDMMNSVGEIGKQAYIPCTINITSGDWARIYIYQTHNDNIDPKIATITKNGTITIFTSDPVLVPTFNISGSQIEAVVTFNFSNYDFLNCSVRIYKFICSLEMTTGSTFNASAEFNLIAPLFQPTVILHGTRYMVNQTANVSLAAINATCNTSRDRYSDTASLIGMRIQNASGADITSFVDVTPYNISTDTCGELVFIQWSDVFLYRSDLNGSNLTCFVETASKSVMSESITLTFLEQQNPTLISTANPAVTNSINADTTLTTPVDISSESSPGTTTKNPPIIASTEMSTTTTTTTQVLSPPYAVVVMKNSIGEIGKQAYIPCTINITSGDWAIIYIYQSHNDNIDPKIATISNNGTKLDFTSDPLLMTTFNISGSQIEAVVTFNFSNYDFSNCSVRLYRFTCSVEMTTGSTFNASAELNLIAPLIQPTVTLHRTQYMFNKTANVSLAGINATCNATQDRSSDYSFTIAMRIQNVSGDDIDSLAEVNSYNVSTNTCGELVFINWSDVFIYRADLNGSSLTCYIKSNDRTVTSENITLTFVEQQMPP